MGSTGGGKPSARDLGRGGSPRGEVAEYAPFWGLCRGAKFADANWQLANFKDSRGKNDERLIAKLNSLPPEKWEIPAPQSELAKMIGGVEISLEEPDEEDA
jgi:hypothetical protein